MLPKSCQCMGWIAKCSLGRPWQLTREKRDNLKDFFVKLLKENSSLLSTQISLLNSLLLPESFYRDCEIIRAKCLKVRGWLCSKLNFRDYSSHFEISKQRWSLGWRISLYNFGVCPTESIDDWCHEGNSKFCQNIGKIGTTGNIGAEVRQNDLYRIWA